MACFSRPNAASTSALAATAGLVGRRQLRPGRRLAAGVQEVVGLHREGEAPKALGAPAAQGSFGFVDGHGGELLQRACGLVDLSGHAGPALGVVRRGLVEDEVAGELGCGDGRQCRPPPFRLPSLTP